MLMLMLIKKIVYKLLLMILGLELQLYNQNNRNSYLLAQKMELLMSSNLLNKIKIIK